MFDSLEDWDHFRGIPKASPQEHSKYHRISRGGSVSAASPPKQILTGCFKSRCQEVTDAGKKKQQAKGRTGIHERRFWIGLLTNTKPLALVTPTTPCRQEAIQQSYLGEGSHRKSFRLVSHLVLQSCRTRMRMPLTRAARDLEGCFALCLLLRRPEADLAPDKLENLTCDGPCSCG